MANQIVISFVFQHFKSYRMGFPTLLLLLVANAQHNARGNIKGRLLITYMSICSACEEHILQLLLQASVRNTRY